MKTSNPFKIIIAGAAGIALFAGCGGADQAPADPTTAAAETTATQTSAAAPSSPASSASVPAATETGTVPATTDPADFSAGAAAIATAELEVPNSQAISIDLGDDNTWTVEVIEGTIEHELDISADGAEILSHEQDDADSDDVRRLESASVSLSEAISQALATVDDPVFDDAELEENGRIFWKIDLSSPDQDIYVDANTGEVFSS